jgi:hypothetical protein
MISGVQTIAAIRTTVLVCLLQVVILGAPIHAAEERLVQIVRFTDYEIGSIDDWLQRKGFEFERDFKRRDRVDFDIEFDRLVIETNRKSFGMIPNESINLPEFTHVEIDWGVNKHPAGVSYEQGVRNEAIMVIIFMGDERQPSGSMFIPDSPYFVGLFLCFGDDRVAHPYVGSYFKKSGRYVCVNRPEPGELVTSRFNLLEAYRNYFDKELDDDPGISGLAIALDTKKAKDAKSSAFIREIRFYR